MKATLGVDFGASMIKVALFDPTEESPHLISLHQDDPLCPATVRFDKASERLTGGLEAYENRCRQTHQVSHLFRDRLYQTGAVEELDGSPIDAITVFDGITRRLRKLVQDNATELGGCAIAVPDHWSSGQWSLPVALKQTGWQPQLFVRESIAALLEANVQRDRALLISLGHGTARATLCSQEQGGWCRKKTEVSKLLSGDRFRKAVKEHFAEEVIQTTRHNPCEHPESDQRLTNALEDAFRKLQRDSSVSLSFQVNGQPFSRTIRREDLFSMSKTTFADYWQQHLDDLISACVGSPDEFDGEIVIWGELAGIWPIAQWLPGSQILPMDCVAAGAARLCRLYQECGIDDSSLVGIRVEDGMILSSLSEDKWQAVSLLETLPDTWSIQDTRATLNVISPADSTDSYILLPGKQSLGRHPECDWVFDNKLFPQISAFHAEIEYHETTIIVRDLDSTNGTFVNGQRIRKETQLAPGDTIRLGLDDPQIVFQKQE